LITARAVQGAGAAAIVPCSLALIAHRFPSGPDRSRALGVWGGVSGIGLAAGPVVGGLLVAWAGWRAVFLVVVPLSLAGMVLVERTLRETPRQEQTRFDLTGQVAGATALLCVTAAFTLAPTDGWAGAPLALLAAGLISAVAFVAVERRSAHPMLPLGAFSRRSFSAAVAVGALFNFALYGTIYCLASNLQVGRGVSAQTAGLALLPLTATVATGAMLSGRIGTSVGPRRAMTLGLAGGTLGAVLLAIIDRAGSDIVLAAGGAVLGTCGLAMPAMTGLALAGAPSGRLALGAGVLNTSRQVGGALGVALPGGIVTASATATLRAPMLTIAGAYAVAVLLALSIPRAARTSDQ
jgi:DHA2 family methylenomycin A resistance protein-like MFS transporter